MKRMSPFFFLFIAMFAWMNIQVVSSQNYGVKIAKAKADENKSQLRFDDLLLGEHTNGAPYNPTTDFRMRSFTLSAWFKTDEVYPERYGCQLLGYGLADYYGVRGSFSVNLEWGEFTLEAKVWSSGDTTNDLNRIKTKVNCKADTWYFLSLAVDDVNKEIRLYIDGELKATANTSLDNAKNPMNGTALLSKKSVFYLNGGTSGGNISAIYDEIQLWNKVLSVEDIKSSMKGYLKAPEGLIGYYTLDNPTSVNVYPNEGYGNTECPATVVSSFVFNYQETTGSYGKTLLKTDAKVDGCDKVNKTAEKFLVNIEKEGEGNIVLVDSESKEYDSGVEFEKDTELSIKATPATNYQIDSVKVNGLKLDVANLKFKVEGKTTLKVFFNKMKTRIAVDSGTLTDGGKYVCIDPLSGNEFGKLTDDAGGYYSIPYGSKVKITVETKDGYLLSGVEVKDSENKPVTLTENSFEVASPNYSILLSFDKVYTVKLEKEGEGTMVLMDDKNVEYTSGSKFKKETNLWLKAVAAVNYQIDSVKVNGTALSLSDLKIKVIGETVVKVYFGLMKTKIAVDNGTLEGGKYICIDPKTNSEYNKKGTNTDLYYEIPYGSKVKVKAEAQKGYILSKMEVKDSNGSLITTGNESSFIASSSKYTVSIAFDKVYAVTYTASQGGFLEIKDAKDNVIIGNEVVAGTEIIITATADKDYVLGSLKINDKAITLTEGKYKMKVNENITIVANFILADGITDIKSGQNIYYDSVNEEIHIGTLDNAVKIYNSIGKEVLSLSGNHINVSSLASGMYILKAASGMQIQTLKFLKK